MPGSSSILAILLNRIHMVRSKQNRTDLISNTLVFSTVVLIMTTIILIAETLFDFSVVVRTTIVFLAALSLVCIGSWMVVRPFLRLIGLLPSITDEEIAGQAGAYFLSIKDRLLNTLQLAKEAESVSRLYSTELIDKTFKDFVREIQPLEFRQVVNTNHLPGQFRRDFF